MRRAFLLSTAIILVSSFDATAQHWTAEEQEVIDFTDACWDMWSNKNVDQYLAECWHEDITFWYSGYTLPFGARWVAKDGPWWLSHNDYGSIDFQPHTIKIYGDAAVIQYQLLTSTIDDQGSVNRRAGARSDFLVRVDGAWIVVAVHTHDAPVNLR